MSRPFGVKSDTLFVRNTVCGGQSRVLIGRGTTRPDTSIRKDAVLAAESGVDGILISNHGGMKSSLSPPGNMFTSSLQDAS